MKVRMRKEDVTSSIGTAIALFIIFLVPFYICYKNYEELGSFKLWFEKQGSFIPFLIIFFVFDLLFLFIIFKPPRKYVGKLIKKEKVKIKGKEVYLMTFEVNELYLREMYCYTLEENPFEIGKLYNMDIKELNWQIKRVDTEIVAEEKEQSELSRVINHPLTPINISVAIVGFIFISFIILCIIGIIFYTEYAIYYLIVIAFMSAGLYGVYQAFKKK